MSNSIFAKAQQLITSKAMSFIREKPDLILDIFRKSQKDISARMKNELYRIVFSVGSGCFYMVNYNASFDDENPTAREISTKEFCKLIGIEPLVIKIVLSFVKQKFGEHADTIVTFSGDGESIFFTVSNETEKVFEGDAENMLSLVMQNLKEGDGTTNDVADMAMDFIGSEISAQDN